MKTIIQKLSINDYKDVLKCLGDGDIKNVNSKDQEIVKKYFTEKWIGYGEFLYLSRDGFTVPTDLIGYCFIKFPKLRPETMTVVHKDYRNQGIATKLRNYALEQREFIGHIVYSSVKFDNLASFKSILKSGFDVFDLTKDGNIQLIKILNYKRATEEE